MENKRLNLDDPEVWNKWRSLYRDLTHEENQEFGRDINARFPTQDHASYDNFDLLFRRYPEANVFEIGGWKGHLAQRCLKVFNIMNWLNIEYCQAAAAESVVKDPRFSVVCPDKFDWFKDLRTPTWDEGERRWEENTVCIAAHVIEHLIDEDLEVLIRYITGIPVVMFEAPIDMGESDWTNYGGTHILKMGWGGVNRLMKQAGYNNEMINRYCFLYTLET